MKQPVPLKKAFNLAFGFTEICAGALSWIIIPFLEENKFPVATTGSCYIVDGARRLYQEGDLITAFLNSSYCDLAEGAKYLCLSGESPIDSHE